MVSLSHVSFGFFFAGESFSAFCNWPLKNNFLNKKRAVSQICETAFIYFSA